MSVEYGISRITINKAVSSLVDEGVFLRMRGRGTFVANTSLDKILERSRTENIAVVTCREALISGEPFYSEILHGIETQAYKKDHNIIFATVEENLSEPSSLHKVVNEKKADGLIIVGKINNGIIMDLERKMIPYVLVDYYLRDLRANVVLIDNRQGIREVVSHLHSLGHRGFAYIDGDATLPSIRERFEEFVLCLKDRGLTVDARNIAVGDLHPDGGYDAAKRIWEAGGAPTAFFAANDEMCIGALKYFAENRVSVPEDVSMVGFDDISWAEHTHPPLTTVKVYKRRMGELAVDLLLDVVSKITEIEKKQSVEIRVPTMFIARSTTQEARVRVAAK